MINDAIIPILFPVIPSSPDVEVENISPPSSPLSPSSTVSLANEPSSSNRHVEENQTMSLLPISRRSSDRSFFYRAGSFYPVMRNPLSVHNLLINPFSHNRYDDYVYFYGLSQVPHAYTQSFIPPILITWTPRTFLYSHLSTLTYGGRVTSTTPPFFQVRFTHLPDCREFPSAGTAPGFLPPSTVYHNASLGHQSDFDSVTSNMFGFVEVEPVVLRTERSLTTTDAYEYEPGEIPSSRHFFTARFLETRTCCDEHTYSTESQRQRNVYTEISLQSSLALAADISVSSIREPNSTSPGSSQDITSSTHETEGTNQPTASASISSVEVEPPASPRSSPLIDETASSTLRPTFTIPPRTMTEPRDFLQKYVLPALTNAISINRNLILSNGRPTEPEEFPVPIVIRSYASPRHPPSYPSLSFSRGNNPNSEIQITIYEATNTVSRLTLMYINVLFATGWVTFLIATTQNDADPGNYSQVWCFPIL